MDCGTVIAIQLLSSLNDSGWFQPSYHHSYDEIFTYEHIKRKAMKQHGYNLVSVKKGSWSFIAMIALMLVFTGCSKKYTFMTSPIAPAAEGNVMVSRDNNDNYKIKLSVMRLASPERLNPPTKYYVAWLKTDNGTSKNIGQLKTESSMFSKTLKSSLETVSSFNSSNFFITAEDRADVQYPSDRIVLQTATN